MDKGIFVLVKSNPLIVISKVLYITDACSLSKEMVRTITSEAFVNAWN
jgi:hypothetical protein